tara:strand:+ start:284 stop:580 length:297 start_codon:yes stop_codon:yes gene_type:complete
MSTTKTVVIPTTITITKPVRIFGQAGVMISYDPMLEYYKDNEMKHTQAYSHQFMSIGVNKNTGTIRLSGELVTKHLVPAGFDELVLLPQQPWKNGGGS